MKVEEKMKRKFLNALTAKVIAIALLTPSYFLTLPGVHAEESAVKKALPRIVIVATGGTIASTAKSNTDTSNYQVTNGVDALINAVPEIKALANVSGEQVINVMSPDISDENRLTLGRRINEMVARDDVDGIVVTHGTATLEQTAYFLNLVVKSDKPIVVVGSMRPASAISADGPANLYDAVKVAADPKSKGKGVLVVLNDRIGAARFIGKTSTWSTETFRSLDQGFLGDIVAGKVRFYQQPLTKHTYQTDFDISKITSLPKVDILYLSYGNTDTNLLRASIDSGAKGVVTVGSGTGQFTKQLTALATDGLSDAKQTTHTKSMAVVNSFWQASGQALYSYDHIVDSNSLPPLKARILLQLALTKTSDYKKIQQYFDEY